MNNIFYIILSIVTIIIWVFYTDKGEIYFELTALIWALHEFIKAYDKYVWQRFLPVNALAYGYVNNYVVKLIQHTILTKKSNNPNNPYINITKEFKPCEEKYRKKIKNANGIRDIEYCLKGGKIWDYPRMLDAHTNCVDIEGKKKEKALFFKRVRKELESRGLCKYVCTPDLKDNESRLESFFSFIRSFFTSGDEKLFIFLSCLFAILTIASLGFWYFEVFKAMEPIFLLSLLIATYSSKKRIDQIIDNKREDAVKNLAQQYFNNFVCKKLLKGDEKIDLYIYLPKNIKEFYYDQTNVLNAYAKDNGYKKGTDNQFYAHNDENKILDFPTTLLALESLMLESSYETSSNDEDRIKQCNQHFINKLLELTENKKNIDIRCLNG